MQVYTDTTLTFLNKMVREKISQGASARIRFKDIKALDNKIAESIKLSEYSFYSEADRVSKALNQLKAVLNNQDSRSLKKKMAKLNALSIVSETAKVNPKDKLSFRSETRVNTSVAQERLQKETEHLAVRSKHLDERLQTIAKHSRTEPLREVAQHCLTLPSFSARCTYLNEVKWKALDRRRTSEFFQDHYREIVESLHLQCQELVNYEQAIALQKCNVGYNQAFSRVVNAGH